MENCTRREQRGRNETRQETSTIQSRPGRRWWQLLWNEWIYLTSILEINSKRLTDRYVVAATAKSLQSCLTLCDPIDGSPPGSPIPGILQARTLEWVAISFSNVWKWKVKVRSLSRVQLLATPWTAAFQAPPSMGFSRQEYWSGVPLPSPRYAVWVRTKKQLRIMPRFFL